MIYDLIVFQNLFKASENTIKEAGGPNALSCDKELNSNKTILQNKVNLATHNCKVTCSQSSSENINSTTNIKDDLHPTKGHVWRKVRNLDDFFRSKNKMVPTTDKKAIISPRSSSVDAFSTLETPHNSKNPPHAVKVSFPESINGNLTPKKTSNLPNPNIMLFSCNQETLSHQEIPEASIIPASESNSKGKTVKPDEADTLEGAINDFDDLWKLMRINQCESCSTSDATTSEINARVRDLGGEPWKKRNK